MFLVIGGLAFISHYYTLNGIKSKTVGDGQHGTARWATKQEIRQTYAHVPFEPELWRKGEHLPAKQGLILGCEGPKDHVTALVDTDDIHAMVTAASGAGKTAFFLYPNIEYALASGMSFLCTDTKGDLFRNYAGIAKDCYGYQIAVLDLRNPTRSDGNNLLHLINKYMDIYKAIQLPKAAPVSTDALRIENELALCFNRADINPEYMKTLIMAAAAERYAGLNDPTPTHKLELLRQKLELEPESEETLWEVFESAVAQVRIGKGGEISLHQKDQKECAL